MCGRARRDLIWEDSCPCPVKSAGLKSLAYNQTFNGVYSITLLTLANKQSPLPPHDDASRLAPPLQ